MFDRREMIVELVNRKGQVNLAQLRNLFPDISDVTLRKDLKYLDEEKRLIRIHGGAKSITAAISKLDTHYTRLQKNMPEKEVVAQKAAKLLKPYTSVYIAPGSTCYALVQKMQDMRLHVFTDGLFIANELMHFEQVKLTLLGGDVDKNSARTTGPSVFEKLATHYFDYVFLGVDGYDPVHGFTHYLDHTNAVCRQLIRHAGKVVVLMDGSKLQNVQPAYLLDAQNVDILVCDRELPRRAREALENAHVTIL